MTLIRLRKRNRRLTLEQKEEIYTRYERYEKLMLANERDNRASLAKEFKVSRSTINDVVNGRYGKLDKSTLLNSRVEALLSSEVEQQFCKLQVEGSIPSEGTTNA